MHAPQALIAAFLILATSTAGAVVGPKYQEQTEDASAARIPDSATTPAPTPTPSPQPAKSEVKKVDATKPAKVKPAAPEIAASKPVFSSSDKIESVDQIKGVGPYKFGSHVADYPPNSLQIVDRRAKGILLRVSPYGENYLVTNVKGLTWGGVPIAGMVLTFREGILIDFQVALKAKRGDLYVANHAFKDKYGSSDASTLPIQTWTGSKIQVTLMFPGSEVFDEKSVDAPGQGRVDLLDQASWKKFETAQSAKLKKLLQQRYEAASQKAKDNL